LESLTSPSSIFCSDLPLRFFQDPSRCRRQDEYSVLWYCGWAMAYHSTVKPRSPGRWNEKWRATVDRSRVFDTTDASCSSGLVKRTKHPLRLFSEPKLWILAHPVALNPSPSLPGPSPFRLKRKPLGNKLAWRYAWLSSTMTATFTWHYQRT
jgi:hypothetical protein